MADEVFYFLSLAKFCAAQRSQSIQNSLQNFLCYITFL